MNIEPDKLNYYIKNLPPFIGKEILKFLIPDKQAIEFVEHHKTRNDGYSLRYEYALRFGKMVENWKGMYLSRIPKKNGAHRYYITSVEVAHYCQGCGMEGCRSEYCRGGWEDETYYDSKYVGKDIEYALYALMFNVDDQPNAAKFLKIEENSRKKITPHYSEVSCSDW